MGNDCNDYIRRIEEIRTENNLSKKALSRMCGREEEYISKLINRGAEPRVGTIRNICEAMDMTLQEFFSSEEIFGTSTPTRDELIILYMSLDDYNKMLLMELARGMKRTQDRLAKND